MTARTDRSEFRSLFPCIRDGREALPVKRDAAPEIFRCVLMFGICLLHVNGFAGSSVSGLSPILMPCVDAFVFISGFYGIRFAISKIVRLWSVAAFCSFLAVVVSFVIDGGAGNTFGHRFCMQLTHNWFLNEYTLLMFFAPILNYVTNEAEVKKVALLLLPFFAAALFWNFGGSLLATCGIPSVPEFGGYSFLMMAVVYVLARLYRRFEIWRFITKGRGLVLFAIAVAGCEFKFSAYHSPFVMLMAILSFTFFYRMKWPEFVGRTALFCAPSMFSIFILHSVMMLTIFIPKIYSAVHARISVPLAFELVIVAGLIYVGGLIGDLLCRRSLLYFARKYVAGALELTDAVWGCFVDWIEKKLTVLDEDR